MAMSPTVRAVAVAIVHAEGTLDVEEFVMTGSQEGRAVGKDDVETDMVSNRTHRDWYSAWRMCVGRACQLT
jgi:hypothetical protein